MARSRNIKPGFFRNEELAELSTDIRLLFIGLWTLADREGRLEDRPRRINAELFPFDSFDVDSMLSQLQGKGFVIRYEMNGSRFLQVVNFVKHQDPHYKEKASEIAPPPGATNLIEATGVTRETRARIMTRDDYRCRACGSEDYLSIDHVVPASRGGSGEDSNLQVLCLKCNREKGNKLPGEGKGARRSKHSDTSLRTRLNVASSTNQGSSDDPGPVPLIPDSLIPDPLISDPKEKCTHTPLREGWLLPKAYGDWAVGEFPHWTPEVVRTIAATFADHWRSSGGASADWDATWRKWCRDPLTQKAHPPPKAKAALPAAPVGAVTVPSNAAEATQRLLRQQREHGEQVERERLARIAARKAEETI